MSKGIGKYNSVKEFPRFGRTAVELGFITEEQLQAAFEEQVRSNIVDHLHINVGNILLNKNWITHKQIFVVLDNMRERKHNVSDFINAAKRDIRVLSLIVLLIAFVLAFINLSLLSLIINILPPLSIATLFATMICLFALSFFLSRHIIRRTVEELEEYDRVTTSTLTSLLGEVEERAKAEQEMHENEFRYRALADRLPLAVQVFSPEGFTLRVNAAWERMWQSSFSALAGYNVLKDRQLEELGILELLKQVFAGQSVVFPIHEYDKAQVEDVSSNGGKLYIHAFAYPVMGDAGRVLEVVVIQEDVSDQKRAEDKLKRNEQLLRLFAEHAPAATAMFDREMRYVAVSRRWISDYNLPETGLIGKSHYEVFPEIADELKNIHRRGLNGESLKDDGAVFLRADGSIQWLRWEMRPWHEANGSVGGIVIFSEDITERKQFEEERIKAQKLESIGTLAGGIAHDFNNLLQGIFGYISLAKLRIDDREKSTAALEEAEKALHNTVRLTNQLLTFSKGGKPVMKTINLLPVIKSAANFALSGSRTTFRLVAGEGMWQADADEGQIGQVIQNIVLNADQAMPDGGTVEIRAGNVQEPEQHLPHNSGEGRCIEITITDTGIGIPEQYLGKIFDPYFTTKEKGSGLGLASSYSIINNHRGMIDVTSRPGMGTTLRILLPAAAVEVSGDEQTTVGTAAALRKGRILIMDDEEFILDVAGELIKVLGHEVAFASHGAEAVEIYREAKQAGLPFDIVILDFTIKGGMGGEQALEHIKAIDADVKAILSSGYADSATLSDKGKNGFSAILSKPYTIEKLRNCLNSLLC